MANSNWFSATNKLLGLALLPQIASTTLFDQGPVAKYQQAAKNYLELAHRHLSLRMALRFTKRRFQLNIYPSNTSAGNTYQLDTGISAEGLVYHSFYNITPGSGSARYLPVWKYEEFKSAWPDETLITQNPPERVIVLPAERTDQSMIHRIQIFPFADGNYSLQYQARLNFYPLNLSTDVLLWPPEYEHALWEWGLQWLEVYLGEGKEANVLSFAQQAVNDVKVMGIDPEEVRKAVQLRTKIRSARWKRSGYWN